MSSPWYQVKHYWLFATVKLPLIGDRTFGELFSMCKYFAIFEFQSATTWIIPNFQFSTYIFSAHITPGVMKLCRVTKVKAIFLVLEYVFNFDLFEFSPAILEKGLLALQRSVIFWKISKPALPRGLPKHCAKNRWGGVFFVSLLRTV